MNVSPDFRRLATALMAGTLALTAAGPALSQEATPVTVALSWLRNGQYAALMAADAQGYFKEEGLAITFIDGGPGKNPVPAVGVGQAQFGVAGSVNVFLARLAPEPVDIVAVGALVQEFPFGFITVVDKDAPDPVPADMAGKTVGIQADGDIFVRAVAERNGVDYASINQQVVQATPEPLIIGQVDYFAGLMTNQAYVVEQEIARAEPGSPLAGKTWKAISFAEYGVPTFGDTIFTSGSVLREQPELVDKFLRAVARGIAFTLENPAETVALLVDYPGQVEDEAKLTWRLAIQNGFSHNAATDANGLLWMDPGIWEQSMAFYEASGLIPRVLPTDEMMTNAHVPQLD